MYEGIARYDLKKNICKFYHHGYSTIPPVVNLKDVWYIQRDAKQDLYISSLTKSIFRYNKKEDRFEQLLYPGKSIEMIDPTCFHIDKQNNFWIGSRHDGLVKLNIDKNIYETFRHDPANANSLSNNHILSLHEDAQGNFWIGTSGGLNYLNTKTKNIVSYSIRNGLPNDQINGIQEDAHHKLWLSTNKGLSTFDPVHVTFKNFDSNDGLQHNEFWHRASCKLKTGELLFGGINGFNIVDPENITLNTHIPPVYLTDFQIFNKPVPIGEENSPLHKDISQLKEITLSYKASVFSFEFVALNYIKSEKNQYSYKMEGFDKDWNMVGNQRKATYTNLDPGTYVFRVKASNNDNLWNEAGTSLHITITPPFWNTWWFKLAGVLLTVWAIYAFYRIKTNQIKLKNKKLESLVAERTSKIEQQKQEITKHRDELKQLNLEISNQNEILERKVEERTLDLQVMNEELVANEEELRQTLEQALNINDKLTESQAKLAEAQRIARLGSWEFDTQTDKFTWSDETYRIFEVSPQIKFYNYQQVVKRIMPAYQEFFKHAVENAIENKNSFELELQLKAKNNQQRWVFIIGKPVLTVEETVSKLIGIIIDITDAKMAEEKLKQQNDELRKINEELDHFVYHASHDLRAPLSSLLGLINIAKMERSEEMRMVYLQMMKESIDKLDKFIQSIIYYSKNARLDVTGEPINFEHLFAETLDDLKYMDGSVAIEKKIVVTGTTPFTSDPFRLKIIFNNIISNAIRYSNPRVESFILVDVVVHEESVSIKFEDNGCGIPEESIDKVFDMFYRASEKNAGSGLGLYIVKEVVEAMKGNISLVSKLGNGTTFYIQLPNIK